YLDILQSDKTLASIHVSEVQGLSIFGDAAFNLTIGFNGQTTTINNFDPNDTADNQAALLQTAFQSLSTIGAGNLRLVPKTSVPRAIINTPLVAYFTGSLFDTDVNQLTLSGPPLNGSLSVTTFAQGSKTDALAVAEAFRSGIVTPITPA